MSRKEEYEHMMDQLEHVRWKHLGHESDEEESLLARMDETWELMSEDERNGINTRPARTCQRKAERFVDVDVSRHPGPVRKRVPLVGQSPS